jgi:hypothetical protein
MSTIQAGTTSTTALVTTGDTTGNIVLTPDSGIATISATGSLTIPVGTTAQRPASPVNGMIRFNTTLGYNEWYSATLGSWLGLSDGPSYSIDILLVAGGAGSGRAETGDPAGGGGAGGFRTLNQTVFPSTGYSILVGAGGIAGNFANLQYRGGDTSFSGNISLGGGGGGNGSGASNATTTFNGLSGGSGGGGGFSNGSIGVGGAGTSGQGFAGGTGTGAVGGGGGGSSAVGGSGSTGTGGAGTANSYSGTSVTYATGGAGATSSSGAGSAGAANTGNGANAPWNLAGQAGGSGILIIRYIGSQRGTGGTITSVGGYTIHTFTSSGTYLA